MGNSDVDITEAGQNILNWRRRYFYLQEYGDQLALMYTSEKNNGTLHLGCIVSAGGKDLSTRTALPGVKLGPIAKDDKKKLILAMKEYDLAFSCEQSKDFYEDTVPQELFPFAIEWETKRGKKKRMVLASLSKSVP